MAVNLLDESALTLAEAARVLPRLRGGKRVHLATLHRWVQRGYRVLPKWHVVQGYGLPGIARHCEVAASV